jgi:hypothetical protein
MSTGYKIYEGPHKGISICSAPSAYDLAILSDQPVLYLPNDTSQPIDSGSGNHLVATHGSPLASALLPNSDPCLVFNGVNQYLEVKNALDLSVSTAMTLEAWMRPDVLTFPHFEGSGYVYWMGKGEPENYEYASRMYNLINEETRPNRISGYAFNPTGGLGVGSYFQDAVIIGEWIHYILIINKTVSPQFPMGYTKIYKNGALRDQDNLATLSINPIPKNAPLRIGTRDLNSFFQGSIGKIALYPYEITPLRAYEHLKLMAPPKTGTIKNVGLLTVGQTPVEGTTLKLNVTRNVPVGHLLIGRVGHSFTAASCSITDSKGNTWTLDRSAPDAAHTLRATIFSCRVSTELKVGDVITIIFPMTTSKCATIDEFTEPFNPLTVDVQNGKTGISKEPNTAAIATANADDLIVGITLVSGDNTVSYTQDPVFESLARGEMSNGEFTVNGGFLSVAALGNYSYKPTLDSNQTWIEFLVAYKGA